MMIKREKDKIEGIFVLVADCGTLPPARANAFVERMKGNLTDLEVKFPNWRLLTIPSQQMHELVHIKLTSKGVLVFYINVGTRSPSAAEIFIKSIKTGHPWLADLDEVAKVFIPVRGDCETSVDYLDLEGERKQVL
jgi:hypothetical protein